MMSDTSKYSDPLWEYTLFARLDAYIPAVRRFWSGLEDMKVQGEGTYFLRDEGSPDGLMYRVARSPARSPIKGVQVFPFVPVQYLGLTGIPGGVSKMVSRVCAGNALRIGEFTIVEKANLPSTYRSGQLLAFVPTDRLEQTLSEGQWVYLSKEVMLQLAQGKVPASIRQKAVEYL